MPALFGFIAIVIGIVNIIFPNAMWYLSEGWKYKNAEPSDAALIMTRVGGGFAIVIGLFIMFRF